MPKSKNNHPRIIPKSSLKPYVFQQKLTLLLDVFRPSSRRVHLRLEKCPIDHSITSNMDKIEPSLRQLEGPR